jgi:hypothetical protein
VLVVGDGRWDSTGCVGGCCCCLRAGWAVYARTADIWEWCCRRLAAPFARRERRMAVRHSEQIDVDFIVLETRAGDEDRAWDNRRRDRSSTSSHVGQLFWPVNTSTTLRWPLSAKDFTMVTCTGSPAVPCRGPAKALLRFARSLVDRPLK